jgi:hypothetical protein
MHRPAQLPLGRLRVCRLYRRINVAIHKKCGDLPRRDTTRIDVHPLSFVICTPRSVTSKLTNRELVMTCSPLLSSETCTVPAAFSIFLWRSDGFSPSGMSRRVRFGSWKYEGRPPGWLLGPGVGSAGTSVGGERSRRALQATQPRSQE